VNKESISVGFFFSKKSNFHKPHFSGVKVKSICSDGFFLKNGIIHTLARKWANKEISIFGAIAGGNYADLFVGRKRRKKILCISSLSVKV